MNSENKFLENHFSEEMPKEELFEHVRNINLPKLKLDNIECTRANSYFNPNNNNRKLRYAKKWNLTTILQELSNHFNRKYSVINLNTKVLIVKSEAETCFDKIITSAIYVNVAIYSHNQMQRENDLKRKKLNEEELYQNIAKIIR